MTSRDFALVGAVLCVAGLAVADALRGDPSAAPDTPRETTTQATTERRVTGSELGSFPAVPSGGEILFADAAGCRLRAVDGSTGRERRMPALDTACELRAAPRGTAFAHGLGAAYRQLVAFRLRDFGALGRQAGSILAFRGEIHWSADGTRAAWCRSARLGFVATGERLRAVEHCPIALTPTGDEAWAEGRRLVTRDGTIVTASGLIYAAFWGTDGSIALLVDGSHVERWHRGRRTHVRRVPVELRRRRPTLSPDNCAALVEAGGGVHLLDLGCFPWPRDLRLEGSAAAWSPDGSWVAVGRPRIAFYDLATGSTSASLTWDASAGALAWRTP